MKFKGKTLQKHIWESMEEVQEYSVWDWVILFEHYGLSIKDVDYKNWVKSLREEGGNIYLLINVYPSKICLRLKAQV